MADTIGITHFDYYSYVAISFEIDGIINITIIDEMIGFETTSLCKFGALAIILSIKYNKS